MNKAAEKTKMINGQRAARVECSLRAWSGHVYVPLELGTELYLKWWELFQESGGGGRESVGHLEDMQRIFEERKHMILECAIDGYEFPETPTSYPLLNFFAAVTQPLILEARFLPNLPGWSSVGTNGSGPSEQG